MSRYDDLRRMREARFAAPAAVTKPAAVTLPVASTQQPVETTECPVCAARRKAKAKAQARWRARLSAPTRRGEAPAPTGRDLPPIAARGEAGQAPPFLVLASWLLGSAKFACLQRQKPAMFAQTPLDVYRHLTGAVCTTSSDGRFAAFSLASRLSNSSDMVRSRQNFLPGTTVAIVGVIWAHGTP
jgi:hypothetical protein